MIGPDVLRDKNGRRNYCQEFHILYENGVPLQKPTIKMYFETIHLNMTHEEFLEIHRQRHGSDPNGQQEPANETIEYLLSFNDTREQFNELIK